MKREISIEFTRITEVAALASYKKIGSGDKNGADDCAVKGMRYLLNQTSVDARIVIGEGEMDDAPMLYIGEELGKGGVEIDIAVDPIEGTRMVALGQPNAISTILACKRGHMLNAPDMYMEKLIYSKPGVIDIDKSFKENVLAISKDLKKELKDIVMVIQNRERHKVVIDEAFKLGLKVYMFEDGDVAESMKVFLPDSDIDFMYSIGGAPEGVLSAGIVRAFDGDMHAKLVNYDKVWPEDSDAKERSLIENERCAKIGLTLEKKLVLNDLINTDDLVFSATGITTGDLLKGVTIKNNIAETETILIRGKTKTIRKIKSTHFIDKKDKYLVDLILG